MTDKRIEKVFTRDEKVEAVFITKKENVRYLSNFKGDESFLLLTRDKKNTYLQILDTLNKQKKRQVNLRLSTIRESFMKPFWIFSLRII